MFMLEQKTLSYGQALHEGTRQEMARDDSVFVYGLGVDDQIGQYGTTLDLHKEFGPNRCFDTPISEDATTGIGIGAALAGMRPIAVHQRMDFLMLCMNQLVNMASKYHYVSEGQLKVPMVLRASIGRSWGQGPQHSQALYSFFMNIPGLKVMAPTTPYDAKGGIIAAIRDDNPVIFIEHRMLFANEGLVPIAPYEIEFGKARILCEGSDITLVGISYTVIDCLRASKMLQTIGINAEVIDLLSLSPLDIDTLSKSAKKTGRIIIVDNGWQACGAGAEIIAQLLEAGVLSNVKAKRMGYAPTTCPTTRVLEDAFYPSPVDIAQAANKMFDGDIKWIPKEIERKEIEEFKGPF